MTDKLETRIVKRKLSELKHLEGNARFMAAAEFGQLVENLRGDGVLSSVPLIYQDTILSGNHRVEAAVAAGIIEADFMEILTEIPYERQIAIALSHNSISGEDDQNKLHALYDSLGIDWKQYSGLSDESFKLEELDISSLSIGAPKYEELTILFLPEEQDLFIESLQKIAKSKKLSPVLTAHYKDYDEIFSAVTQAKDQLNVHNTAMALRVMCDLALDKLSEISQTPDPEQ